MGTLGACCEQGEAYLGALHAKKLDATAARKERERRRRKVLLEQGRNAAEGEAKAREEALLAR
jgi:tmRNA-binding protein